PEFLRDALGLTPMQARLTLALADGRTIKDYAAERGRKVSSVRWHLHNILQRTNCSSQLQLIRLVWLLDR
ncbi:MAG: hypothetical protein ACREC6_10120, partial [Hyphomicrobiaceae bacterium]